MNPTDLTDDRRMLDGTVPGAVASVAPVTLRTVTDDPTSTYGVPPGLTFRETTAVGGDGDDHESVAPTGTPVADPPIPGDPSGWPKRLVRG